MQAESIGQTHKACHHASGAMGRELLIGMVVALVCSVVWAAITHNTDMDLGYAAPAVGLVIGLAIAATARKRSIDNGISAAGLAAIAVLLGKLIIVQWGITSQSSDQATHLPSAAATQINDTAQTEPQAQPESQATAAINPEAEEFARVHPEEMREVSRFKSALTLTDLIWLGGAAVAAFIAGLAPLGGKKGLPEEPGEENGSEVASNH